MKDRDKVKELLQQILPNFKRKVDKELEEKNRLLTDNPALLQLYKDLVITKVITSEEFWETHAKKYTTKQDTQKQDIGVSGAFLADIKPQTDGCNGLKYNLTADIIECIFKTYPAVRKKHIENVPNKLSEAEFWTKFFQSHYFHRDRISGGTKDIFTECGKIDEQTLKAAVSENAGDPLLDIRQFQDSSLDEGFCSAGQEKGVVNSGNIVHQNMIKRFNQHSFMVLKTCTDVKTLNSPAATPTTSPEKMANGTNNGHKHNNNNNNKIITNGLGKHSAPSTATLTVANGSGVADGEPQRKRARILEKIHFDDLDVSEEDKTKLPEVNLTKVERYLHGPTMQQHHESDEEVEMDLLTVQSEIVRLTDTWHQRLPHKALVNPTAAVNALGELSPGGALMRGFQEQSLARKCYNVSFHTQPLNLILFPELVPPEVEKELRSLYLSLAELLKHFWRSFPAITLQQEEKATHMHEALQRFQMAKLVPFEVS